MVWSVWQHTVNINDTRYQSNVEKFRTHISTHRCDVDMSAQYRAMEDVFIKIGKGNELRADDPVYKLNSAEKDCLDSFMEARNNALLWGKSDVDETGKPKLYDDQNRPKFFMRETRHKWAA